MKSLTSGHKALANKTTIFLKQVKEPTSVKRLLQPATSNGKLSKGGSTITKGKWKGFPLYSLSLEERATCPTTCNQWANCYGNNMPFANRIDHQATGFLKALETEIKGLSSKHPKGFVIRLHVLGDFYSTGYVNFWSKQLKKYPNLHLFGYTHRLKTSAIGQRVNLLNNSSRAWIRWSDAGGNMSANCPPRPGDVICPEQTGKTESCLTCGLCWSITKPIGFLQH